STLDKEGEVTLGDYWSADGFNDEGTYYTAEELEKRSRRQDDNGVYYLFDDFPGRIFLRGKTIFWNAELSLVENADGTHKPLITFSYGMELKGGRAKLIEMKKVNQFSINHQKHIKDAIIK
ncbi:MAG: hypothetical protein AAFO07_33635, partial [Bacteroidota bacterium]